MFPTFYKSVDFYSVWIAMCLFKLLDCTKQCPHSTQHYCFSPVWIFMCLSKSLDCIKHFPHSTQVNDFSLVWNFMCIFNSLDCIKHFPHFRHLYGYSCVNFLMIRQAPQLQWNIFHILYSCVVSHVGFKLTRMNFRVSVPVCVNYHV